MPNKIFDPRRAGASPHHAQVYATYQIIYTAVEFAAAIAFVVGSVLFFSDSLATTATWFFLVGSVLFAVRPTVSVLREAHLARLPLPGDHRHAHSTHNAHRVEPGDASHDGYRWMARRFGTGARRRAPPFPSSLSTPAAIDATTHKSPWWGVRPGACVEVETARAAARCRTIAGCGPGGRYRVGAGVGRVVRDLAVAAPEPAWTVVLIVTACALVIVVGLRVRGWRRRW